MFLDVHVRWCLMVKVSPVVCEVKVFVWARCRLQKSQGVLESSALHVDTPFSPETTGGTSVGIRRFLMHLLLRSPKIGGWGIARHILGLLSSSSVCSSLNHCLMGGLAGWWVTMTGTFS